MSYPTGEDLANWLVDGGVIDELPVDYSQYDLAMNAAIKSWEYDTGFVPFIAETSDSTNTYLTRGCGVNLRGGYVSITSVSIDGTTLTPNSQYVAMPVGTTPITYLDLAWAPDAVVTVVGKRGYAADCPDDVSLALLNKAASLVLVNNGKTNGQIGEIRQGEVSIKYSTSASQAQIWTDAYTDVMRRYRRPKVF